MKILLSKVKKGDNISFAVEEDHWDGLLMEPPDDGRVVIECEGFKVKAYFIELLDRPRILVEIEEVVSIN